MLYLAALFSILTFVASLVAFDSSMAREINEDAQYAAAMFALAFFFCLVRAYMRAPKP